MKVSRGKLVQTAGAAAITGASMGAAEAQAPKRWGLIGMIKPTITQGPIEELIPFLPAGLGYAPVYLNIQNGATSEFATAMPVYERNIEILAAQKCDIIHPEGAPPFMLLGPQRETEVVDGWKKRYGIPMFTSSQNHVNAFRALKVKRIVGATYLPPDQNRVFANYFNAVGFNVLSMDGFKADFNKIQDVPAEQIADYIRANVRKQTGVEGIYVLGSGWRILEIIEPLEKEFGIPFLHPVIGRAWQIQKLLGIRQPKMGYGRLIAELP
jgi:maleate isomerase